MSNPLFLFVTIMVASFLSIFGVEIINIVTTSAYVLGALAIPFLTFTAIFNQAFQITTLGIALKEKTWYYTIIIVITAVFNVGINFWLIPKYGFVGAGLATLLSYVLYWALAFGLSQKFFKVDHNLIKIFFFIITAFCVSFGVPYLQLNHNIHIHFLLKSGIMFALVLMSFVLRIIKYQEVINYLKSFRKNNTDKL